MARLVIQAFTFCKRHEQAPGMGGRDFINCRGVSEGGVANYYQKQTGNT